MEPEPHEHYLQFALCKLIRILDQGSGEVFLVKFGIQKNFAGTIRNHGLWNLDPSSTDEEYRIQGLQFGIHNVESTIQDCLGLPYIGGATQFSHY